MSLASVGLVLLSAVTHAVWNLLAKRSPTPMAFLWWAISLGALANLALLAATSSLALPVGIWGYLVFGGLAEAVYLLALSRAYRGDLSLAYPVSRGSAPLFIALWSAALLGERLPWPGYLGIALLIAGVALAGTPGSKARPDPATVGWALLAGVAISVYSIFDKLSLGYISPLRYNFWSLLAMSVFTAPFLITEARSGRAATAGHDAWALLCTEGARVLGGGVLVMVTALLMLVALSTSPVSYVGALRGTSVLVGAFLGHRILKEHLGRRRVFAAALLTAGTACLALGG